MSLLFLKNCFWWCFTQFLYFPFWWGITAHKEFYKQKLKILLLWTNIWNREQKKQMRLSDQKKRDIKVAVIYYDSTINRTLFQTLSS